MSQFFFILTLIAMGLVLVVWLGGIVSMTKGGKFNKKYGNALMRARVYAQALALLFFALALATAA